MKTSMVPGCCGLKTIHAIGCIGKKDAFSEKEALMFDEMTKAPTAQEGMWAAYGRAPDTIAIISESPRYTKPEEFAKQKAFLESKGWKLLATWKSHESGTKNHMYGSAEIIPAGASK